MKYIKTKSGETLVEAIVSLAILMITTAVASSTVIYAMQSVALSRDYLIAQNLADEAIEIVKNIRNTNAMKNSTNIDQCWIVINPNIDCSVASNKLESGSWYIPNLDAVNNNWTLMEGTIKPESQIYKSPDNTYPFYSHETTIDGAPTTPTNYYRQIKVLKMDPATGNPTSVLVEVSVKFYTGAKENELKGVTLITNHE